MTRNISIGRYLLYGTLAVLALAYLLPAYMMVVTALKMPENISLPRSWHPPVELNGSSFLEAVALLKPNFVNSIVLTIFATIFSTVLGSINGYVFSKWKFKGSEVVFTLFLFGMFIPYQVILIPLFQTLRAINLYYAGRRRFFLHLWQDCLSAFHTGLRGHEYLAVHSDLERVFVGYHPDPPHFQPHHRGFGPIGRRPGRKLESAYGRFHPGGYPGSVDLHFHGQIFYSRAAGRIGQGIIEFSGPPADLLAD